MGQPLFNISWVVVRFGFLKMILLFVFVMRTALVCLVFPKSFPLPGSYLCWLVQAAPCAFGFCSSEAPNFPLHKVQAHHVALRESGISMLSVLAYLNTFQALFLNSQVLKNAKFKWKIKTNLLNIGPSVACLKEEIILRFFKVKLLHKHIEGRYIRNDLSWKTLPL